MSTNKVVLDLESNITSDERRLLADIEISLEEERKFGQRLLTAYMSYLKLNPDRIVQRGGLCDYLQDTVSPIASQMNSLPRYESIEVNVIAVDWPLAVALPGGRLLISTKMLNWAKNVDALIGIVAHELSHIDRGHQLERLKRAKLKNLAVDDLNDEQILKMAKLPYTAAQEAEADADAILWMRRANYSPDRLVQYLERAVEYQSVSRKWSPSLIKIDELHPDAERRVIRVRELARKPNEPK